MNLSAFTNIGVGTWTSDSSIVKLNLHLRWLLGSPSTDVPLRDFASFFNEKSVMVGEFLDSNQDRVSFPWTTRRNLNVQVEIVREGNECMLVIADRQIPAGASSLEVQKDSGYDLSVFFTHSNDLLCVFGVDGHFKLINSAFTKLLGYEANHVYATPYTEFVHPDDLDSSSKRVEYGIEHGIDGSDFVNRYRKVNGEYVYISWRGLQELPDGSVYCVGKNVTETIQYVESLSLFKLCFDIAIDALVIGKPDTTVLHANKKFCELVGLPIEKVIGMPFLSFVHPDDLKPTQEIAGKMYEEGIDAVNFKNRYRHSSGSYTTLSWMGAVDKESGMIMGIARDITEQERKDSELLRTSEALQESQTMAKIGSWEVHVQNGTIYWSDETRNIHEVPNSFEVTLDVGVSFYTEKFRPIIEKDVQDAIASGKSFDGKYQIETYEGNLKWVRSVGKAEFDDKGEVVRLFGVFQDITDQMRYEQELIEAKVVAESASKQKADFLSMMSHEIRTPLNAIVSMTYFLRSKSPREDQIEFLDVLDFSSENLMSLVSDILDFSKIEAGRVDLELASDDLHEVFYSVWGAFKIQAVEKKIDFELDARAVENVRVLIDRGRFVQVLNNLVGNAVKFTDEGRVSLSVDAKTSGDTIVLDVKVEDTGHGISPEGQRQIFSPFIQVGSGSTREHGGSGLGLSISKNLVELMGGELHVQSELGKGSTFSFQIELKLDSSTKSAKETSRDLTTSIEGARVYLVEDNETNIFVAQTMLEGWGCKVTVARNGKEAVDNYEHDTYDVVLMDLHMPIMGGEEATGILKDKQREVRKFVPIIALTASALSESRARVLLSGLDDFVTKPINPIKLKRVIAQNMERFG